VTGGVALEEGRRSDVPCEPNRSVNSRPGSDVGVGKTTPAVNP
jgi:hypothetical protein